MRIKIFSLLAVFLIISSESNSQNIRVDKVEPPNWWAGMKCNGVQLMIYGRDLQNITAKFNTDKIVVDKVFIPENSSYAFIDILIDASIEPAVYKLNLTNSIHEVQIDYEIKPRNKSLSIHQGFNATDVIYLIVPDRFTNGDQTNDHMEGYNDTFDPAAPIARHGGDIQGMIDKLDYLSELGITAIWSTPLIENNTNVSYHGYSATDHYKIDPRFGTNELYKTYVEEAHRRGLKIIYDHVSNHISINHPWMQNLPMDDWINGSVENHLNTRHDKMSYADVHRDSSTIINLNTGWFTDYMPDLNQENPYVEKYLIQNMLWWLEFSGLDGIREDTYPYTDQIFLSNFNKAVQTEYPNLNIVGEVWDGNPTFLAYFQKDSPFNKNFNSYLPVVTDFGMRDIIADYAAGRVGLYKIYQTLAMDFLFPDPYLLMVFVDNHDIARLMYLSDGDFEKAKKVLTILFTTRGIPQILYGTEIGMVGAEDHGRIRSDFPGGFYDNSNNAFTSSGRSSDQNTCFSFLQHLISIRNSNPGIALGKLVQFPPWDNLYIYFRIYQNKVYLIAVNDNEHDSIINLKDFESLIEHRSQCTNLLEKQEIVLNSTAELIVSANSASIFLIE